MANHGYIIPETIPDADVVHQALVEAIERKFPMLKIERSGENNDHWRFYAPSSEIWCRSFWFGDMYVNEGDEPPNSILLDDDEDEFPKVFAVEFRHGFPSTDMMWWIEAEIQAAIQAKIGGVFYDDGIGGPFKMSSGYDCLSDYLRKAWKYNKMKMALARGAIRGDPPEVRSLWRKK